jgi:hypothetical protein
MKPNRKDAMQTMINEINQRFPMGAPDRDICLGICSGCPKKLLQFMEMQLEDWQEALDNGEIPTFKQLQKRATQARKIEAVLIKNELITTR